MFHEQMSLEEREPYEEMARQYKHDPSLRGGKLASDGTRVEDNLLEMEEKERLENKMKQDVKRYCNSDCTTEEQFRELAPKKLFYFMSFNLFCFTDEEEFIPIEVGIVEYSIQHGIHREYSKIIHPGRAPTGYTGVAKKLSEEQHQIDVFGDDCKEKNIRVIFEEMRTFINPLKNEEYPPIFCERSHLPVANGCLSWFCNRTARENIFEVWDSAYLLMELRAGVGSPLPSYSVASDLLNKTSFDYHPSTRCEFHEEKDIHYCALSYSKRLCYLLSDAVCNLFDIQLTEKHIPNRAVEEKSYSVSVTKETARSSDIKPVRLDKTVNYYQNDQREVTSQTGDVTVPRQPRHPHSIADEMKKLQLNVTAATVPGGGIGRGIRRK